LNEKDKLKLVITYNTLNFSYPSLDPSNPNSFFNYKLDTYSINGGLVHQFDESFKLQLSLGWRYSETKFNRAIFETDPKTGEIIITGTEPATSNASGSNFLLLLDKNYYYTTFQFRGQENLFTDPQTGQTYPSINIGFSVKHEFTDKLYGSFASYFYRNKASAGEFNNRLTIDYKSYYTTLGLSYVLNKNLTLIVAYSNTIFKNSFANAESKRNNVYLQFNFALKRPFIVS
jgi:long-subunit fatty acid transport protein